MAEAPQTFTATVGYIRGLGFRSLCVYCRGKREGAWPCHHGGIVDVSALPDVTTLASIESRLACTTCGAIGDAEALPNWSELHATPRYAGATWMSPPSLQR